VQTKKEIAMADRKIAVTSTDVTHPTGKYTLNGWGQTEADFAFFDLAQDKVELKSDGWRTEKIADDPNVYEWWYFDIHNHDRTVITGMLFRTIRDRARASFRHAAGNVQDGCQPKQGAEQRDRNVPN
jgi:hypothetical protein